MLLVVVVVDSQVILRAYFHWEMVQGSAVVM